MEFFIAIALLCQIQGKDYLESRYAQHVCQVYYIDCLTAALKAGKRLDDGQVLAKCIRNK